MSRAESEPGNPADGEVLVRNIYMSVDPYMRGRMNDIKSYVPPFQIGEVLQAGVVGHGHHAVLRHAVRAEPDVGHEAGER